MSNDTLGKETSFNEEEGDFDLDKLDAALTAESEKQYADLEFLKVQHDKIGSDEDLCNTVMSVIWDQFITQIGAVAGEDFIKENRGKLLDLSKDAHFQTTENFAKGNIADHNTKIDYQKRYDNWQSDFSRDEQGHFDPADSPLTSGARKPYDEARPMGSASAGTDVDHTIPVSEIIRDPQANAHLSQEERVRFANSEHNLNEMDAAWNRSKGDKNVSDWLDNPNSNGQRPRDIENLHITPEDEAALREKDASARMEYEVLKESGEERSVEAGRQSRREEAARVGGEAMRAAVTVILADLTRKVIWKFVEWLRSDEKSLDTFIEEMEEAFKEFVSHLKNTLLYAVDAAATSVLFSIYGEDVARKIKKTFILLKHSTLTMIRAIDYVTDPANRSKSTDILVLEVSKIILSGLTAVGSIEIGEKIAEGLSKVPAFKVKIPLMGTLADILGIFFGSMISGVVGALALDQVNRYIAKRLKQKSLGQIIEKNGQVLRTQQQLIAVKEAKTELTKQQSEQSIRQRHNEAGQVIQESLHSIFDDDDTDTVREIDDDISAISSDLDDLLKSL